MTIAHLSDIHLSLDHHRSNTPRFRRILDHLSQLNPDHIVVTGDVSWDARESELLLARRMFEEYGFYSTTKLSVIPGNHDVFGGVHTADEALNFYSRCRWTPFEERLAIFRRVFNEVFDGCLHTSRKYLFPFAKVIGDLALVGLNSITRHSSLKNPFGSNGLVGKKERRRLALLMSSKALTGKRTIALVHHHFHKPAWEASGVLTGLWVALENKTMKLRKKPSLLRLFKRSGVELVLHGHHHDNCEYERSGIRFMNAGGTLMGPDRSLLSVNIVRVEDRGIRTEVHRLEVEPQRTLIAVPFENMIAVNAA